MHYLRDIIRQNAFGPDFHHYQRIQSELTLSQQQKQQQQQQPSFNKNSSYSYTRILGLYPLAAMINHACTTNATRIFVPVQTTITTSSTSSSNGGIGISGGGGGGVTATTTTNVMIATATKDIAPGEEILWSYIPPTTSLPQRQEALSHYGFQCHCPRCIEDANLQQQQQQQQQPDLLLPTTTNNNNDNNNWNTNNTAYPNQTKATEETGSNDALFVSHSVRLAYTNRYIQYFNETLQALDVLGTELVALQKSISITATNSTMDQQQQQLLIQQQTQIRTERFIRLLQCATELHHAFCTIHPASTEHLSIVYLCYDLTKQLQQLPPPTEQCHTDTLFSDKYYYSSTYWMNELRRVHQCRYSRHVVVDVVMTTNCSSTDDNNSSTSSGSAGHTTDTDNNNNNNKKNQLLLLSLLQHTKSILRTAHGWNQAKYRFI
ncbi:SET methyltransferase domain containing protein [Nitzschia inconspicua]|uniref:SET methyltransferase domain containing protein n=1 Tax=Nitzschia inconspicua TaxID=303405 RepID=A0A9K3M4U0_9STRA|nr:SET methyltransferase domain containing protein [Nitzschia inconspicua]